jgi:hypothetical protein
MRFDAYWHYYLQHHTHRANRLLHFLGWLAFLFGLATSLIARDVRVLFAGVATAYAVAWTGHFIFERDIPETWKRPVLANLASLRLFVLMATGRLGEHLIQKPKVLRRANPATDD